MTMPRHPARRDGVLTLALAMLLAGPQVAAAQEAEPEIILLPTITVETDLDTPPPVPVPVAAPLPETVAVAPPPRPKAPPRKAVKRRRTTPAADPVVPPVSVPARPEPVPAGVTGAAAMPGATGGTRLSGAALQGGSLASNDTASLMQRVTGAAVWGAGGVSGLPAINGMGADRVQVAVGGMLTGPACPNQMNPTLSYIAPEMVGSLHAHSAAAPVSAGGDFSGGRISVEPALPAFAAPGQTGPQISGTLSTFLRSNPGSTGLDASLSVAGTDRALSYRGSFVRAGNYRAGDGTEILSSEFESLNHALDYVRRDGNTVLRLSGGLQNMPYQGFPTQPMDMTKNRSAHLTGRYDVTADWGRLEVGGFVHHVRHGMNLLDDKLNWPSFDGSQAIMPMDTRATDMGATLKLDLARGKDDTLRLGAEAYRTRLDDWWNPVDPDPGAMMSPEAFIMLNDARRDRIGAFAEWERRWRPGLTSILGLRYDHVRMNTGPVHGYGATDPAQDPQYGGDALVFNAMERGRSDTALDGSAALRWEPAPGQSHELAFARKTRAPNLYERYAWSTNIMAMQMTGWFGDGNGYVGDPDLRPEVNHSVDLTLRWRDAERDRWEFTLNPTYSFVRDYIDADRCTGSAIPAVYTRCGHPDNATGTRDFVFLRFANHDAHIAGLNMSGRLRLAETARFGRFDLRMQAAALRGWRGDGVDLYNIMPPNAKLTLEHRLGGWNSALELQLVSGKHLTSDVRNEVATPGYGLVNLRSSYERGGLRLDLGIENLLNRRYALPLGGANLTNDAVVVGQMVSPVHGQPILGAGRSVNLRLTLKF